MKNSDEIFKKITDLTLTGNDLDEFKKHIAADNEFRSKVISYINLVAAIKSAGRIISEKKHRIVFIKKIALAATVVFIAGATLIYSVRIKNQAAIAEKTAKEIYIENNAKLFAGEWFKPNPILENNIHVNYRATTELPVFISPADSAFINKEEKVFFKIESGQGLNFNILVFNNKLVKMYQSPVIKGNKFILEHDFPIGAYYWKIQIGLNSYWAGKFYIINVDLPAN